MTKGKRQLRAEAVERLKDIKLDPEGSSHERLSAICGAIYAPSYGWTHGACDGLARALVDLLTDGEPCANNLTRLYGRDVFFNRFARWYATVKAYAEDNDQADGWLMSVDGGAVSSPNETTGETANPPIRESDAQELVELFPHITHEYDELPGAI